MNYAESIYGNRISSFVNKIRDTTARSIDYLSNFFTVIICVVIKDYISRFPSAMCYYSSGVSKLCNLVWAVFSLRYAKHYLFGLSGRDVRPAYAEIPMTDSSSHGGYM